nr:reverse transcriptase domain-containing protein [Tanacetum cinerariifolium]
MWTLELLKERELAEIKFGGLRKGELAGPYVEKEDDPMPDNSEVTYIVANVFLFKYNERTAGVRTDDSTMTNQRKEPSLEIDEDFDTPMMGSDTQLVVFESADKLYEVFERNKRIIDLEIPSFSLGLTQEDEMETGLYAAEYEIVPLNYVNPTKEMMRHGKRVITESERMKSPFYVRVVNADNDENNEEKKLAVYLLSKMAGDVRTQLYQLLIAKKVKKVVTRKRKKDEDINYMKVTSMLHKKFDQYLLATNHGKAAEIIEAQLVHGTFDWQTDKRSKDCGIFLMRHMESYMGNELGKWKYGLDDEGYYLNLVYHIRIVYLFVRILPEMEFLVISIIMRSKQPFILEESPIDTMADQRTMAELLRAPTEGYAVAIVVPSILAEQFELKHSLINMMNSNQFFGLEKGNPHDHIPKLTHAVNQQTSVVTTAMTPILKQFQATPPPPSVKAIEEICVTYGGAHPYYQCLAAGGNTFPELRDNIQGYVAAAAVNYNQGNFVYRPPGLESLPSNTVANPKGELKSITTRSETSRTGKHTLNENCSAVILKKLPENLGDPGKFLISCGFNELKRKALANLGSSINLMTLSVWKKLGLPELISTRMTVELANRAICTPTGIARDVFVPTARALIDVHGEEMILRDGDERLTLNMTHDTSSYSNQPQKESINLINVFNDSNEDFLKDLFSTNHQSGNLTFSSHPELTLPEVKDDIFDPEGGNVLLEKLLDLDSTKDLHPPLYVNPLSGCTTSSSSPNQLLEEFADELALITFPPRNDDLYNLADLNDNLVDSMPEMFTDEHALDYSSPPLFDEYDDDLFESDIENVYDDPFDSKGEKIKESKLLIDELDLPCDFLLPSEYDSFLSEDFPKLMLCPQPTMRIRYLTQIFPDLKTHAKGFCPPVFTSSASLGNHIS